MLNLILIKWVPIWHPPAVFSLFNPTIRGGLLKPPWTKIAISTPFCDPIEPKKFDFSQKPMAVPPIPFLGPWNGKKRGFYSIFVDGGDKIRILKFGFLAFFEAKMTKIDILNPKLIVPNYYQQFWVHFEWFLSLFQISDIKWLLS